MSATLAACDWRALGTTVRVLVTRDDALDAVRSVVEDELAAIDIACSRFRDDSDLARVNAAAGTPVVVGDLFLTALAVALRAARLTDGIVDPTIGRALRIAGYDRDFGSLERSGPAAVVHATRVPGWHVIEIDTERSTVRVPRGVELDFGATAKALAADRAAARAAAITDAGVLVSLGGDIAVAGCAPEDGWVVRVTDDHAAPVDAPGQSVAIVAGGLATSSTTVRHWQRGDAHLHHLIDPATGSPAAEHWRTVSVLAGSCVDANTATTAAIVRGADAPEWLASLSLPARLVARDGRAVVVAGWPEEQS